MIIIIVIAYSAYITNSGLTRTFYCTKSFLPSFDTSCQSYIFLCILIRPVRYKIPIIRETGICIFGLNIYINIHYI